MDWTKLFKSKPKLKSDSRIRWFGKLPTYPDYYSSHVDEEWAVEFNDWVLKGFELYQGRLEGDQKSSKRLPVSGFAVRLPKSGMTVFASLFDYGGDMRGRPFPIIFYAGVPSLQWPGPTSDRVQAASRVLAELMALRGSVTRFLNMPGRFEATFGDKHVDLGDLESGTTNTSWMTDGGSLLLSDWFGQIKPSLRSDGQCAWFRAVSAWGQNLASHEGDAFEPTLRLPLAMGRSLEVQIAGWIRWLESYMNMQRRFVSLFITGEPGNGTGFLTLIAREVLVDDFLLLTPMSGTLPYLDDLTEIEVPEDVAADEGAGESRCALDSPDARWLDFTSGGVKIT